MGINPESFLVEIWKQIKKALVCGLCIDRERAKALTSAPSKLYQKLTKKINGKTTKTMFYMWKNTKHKP